jgi:hypothetical protein
MATPANTPAVSPDETGKLLFHTLFGIFVDHEKSLHQTRQVILEPMWVLHQGRKLGLITLDEFVRASHYVRYRLLPALEAMSSQIRTMVQ